MHPSAQTTCMQDHFSVVEGVVSDDKFYCTLCSLTSSIILSISSLGIRSIIFLLSRISSVIMVVAFSPISPLKYKCKTQLGAHDKLLYFE